MAAEVVVQHGLIFLAEKIVRYYEKKISYSLFYLCIDKSSNWFRIRIYIPPFVSHIDFIECCSMVTKLSNISDNIGMSSRASEMRVSITAFVAEKIRSYFVA